MNRRDVLKDLTTEVGDIQITIGNCWNLPEDLFAGEDLCAILIRLNHMRFIVAEQLKKENGQYLRGHRG